MCRSVVTVAPTEGLPWVSSDTCSRAPLRATGRLIGKHYITCQLLPRYAHWAFSCARQDDATCTSRAHRWKITLSLLFTFFHLFLVEIYPSLLPLLAYLVCVCVRANIIEDGRNFVASSSLTPHSLALSLSCMMEIIFPSDVICND